MKRQDLIDEITTLISDYNDPLTAGTDVVKYLEVHGFLIVKGDDVGKTTGMVAALIENVNARNRRIDEMRLDFREVKDRVAELFVSGIISLDAYNLLNPREW